MLNLLNFVFTPPDNTLLYTGSYNPLLVSLSIALTIFASYTALLVSQHVSRVTTKTAKHLWIAGGGLTLGVGIWAMHFVGMLAFNLPCSSSYDPAITAMSMIPGILAGILALKIISRRELTKGQLALGGLLLGAGVGAMHYAGMAAMRLNGLIRYDIKLFLLSILVAIALATLALWIKFRLQSWQARWSTGITIASAVVMGLGVSGMHYTAMAAAYFISADGISVVDAGMSPAFLSAIVLTATGLVMVLTLVAIYIEKPNLSSLAKSYKLVGSLILCWILIAWLSADFYYNRVANDLYQSERQFTTRQAELIASNIDDNIELLKGISMMYSRDVDTQRVLHRIGINRANASLSYEERKQSWSRDKTLSELNRILEVEAPQLGIDLIFILNAAGDCVAASNADKPGSPVGTNYADREYFTLVQAGQPGHQYAVGRTTHVPGLYYVSPVLHAGHFVGAVVVKRDVPKFARWTNPANAFMTDAHGVIILAPNKSLEFRTLPDANITKLSPKERLAQYVQSEFEPVKMTPWKGGRFPSVFLIDGNNPPILISSRPLSDDGIGIYVTRSLEELLRIDAEKYWLFLLLAAAGSLLIVATSVLVIHLHESKKTAADLRVAASAFESQEGMMITDSHGLILRVNGAFTNITGYNAEEVMGKNPRMLSSGRHNASFYAAMWQDINRKGAWEGEVWNRRKNGEIYPEYLTITAVKDQKGIVTNYVAALADITSRKTAEEEIRNLAFYDSLTRLPNRRLLIDRLKHALATSTRSGKLGTLLFLDLDNFKTINDTLGHATGDLLLQQTAQRLLACVREGDTVARLGGDEFVVILENLSTSVMETAAQTELIGEKIRTELRKPYLLDSLEHSATCSIGATLFSDHELGMDELMKQADIAMYQAKKAGRNVLRFFDPKMQDTITARASLEKELSKSVEKQQLQLYYQIQVDDSRRPLGAETLIRWIHPERGMVSPADFIPLAEESGLILPIGQWVLETACAQIKTWQTNVLTRDLVLAVNVSAKQFHQDDFADQVQAAVKRHAINPTLLKLELTEGMLVQDIEDTVATMAALKEIGIQFSLDDFGTGYSSLQYLKRLPLNQLKIDQSFVRDIATDSNDAAIVGTIIAMAHSLNLDVIAEGVETEEQKQLLLAKNCTHFQGYLFGKPMPIDQFEVLLKRS